ncbi:hypothetical protein AVEN_48884-1 [Araneus ventricosus]|uniref:Uncharacterized protein n=1 Tax=Araneus ventricosus TaxID=182803 RepID=A0A4Y2AGI4_ARAVE|nr:hypothetical protein AVEN_48884-1 [Araneus ventricosus]
MELYETVFDKLDELFPDYGNSNSNRRRGSIFHVDGDDFELSYSPESAVIEEEPELSLNLPEPNPSLPLYEPRSPPAVSSSSPVYEPRSPPAFYLIYCCCLFIAKRSTTRKKKIQCSTGTLTCFETAKVCTGVQTDQAE